MGVVQVHTGAEWDCPPQNERWETRQGTSRMAGKPDYLPKNGHSCRVLKY